jgi:hypothetical protein
MIPNPFDNILRKTHYAVALLVMILGHSPTYCAADEQQFTEIERFIIQKVKDGEIADLRDKKGGRRPVSAAFLRKLLLGDFKQIGQAKEVDIEWALITGDLDLTYTDVPFHTYLINCKFPDAVICDKASFESFHISDSWFCSDVSCVKMKTKGTFRSRAAHFTNPDVLVDFKGIAAGESLDFIRSEFTGGVSFSYCETSVGYFHDVKFGPDVRLYNLRIRDD